MNAMDRRKFLKLMAASLALAGVGLLSFVGYAWKRRNTSA